ncbi:PIN domain-containing protein [Prauserella shujinwangii]|uniref:PIN domain-containing protein n=1 Tax=Prauserella shujinwangii TaxID=1453103 RepID=UPI0031840DE6
MLLDTCAVIDLDQLDLGDLAQARPLVSAVSIGELAYGLDVDDPVERAARTERYYAALRRFEVVPFDTAAAKVYGTMAALVRRAGRSPRPRRLDLQIAATAAASRLPLVTRNAADFAGLDRLLDVISV